jgi:predicted secreted protein
MGDGVTDDKELVIKIADSEAGTTKGQLIIDDIEFSGERDNTEYAGIGNDTTQGVGYGNKTYSLSTTSILNGAAADLALNVTGDDTVGGFVRTPNMQYHLGKLDWNSFDVSASDDGDVTFSCDFNVRNVEEESR